MTFINSEHTVLLSNHLWWITSICSGRSGRRSLLSV